MYFEKELILFILFQRKIVVLVDLYGLSIIADRIITWIA